MITGVWISPDRKQVAVQVYEDSIVLVDESGERLMDEVPSTWRTLYGDD